MTPPPKHRGFFRMPRFRFWSVIGLLALCIVTLNPATYAVRIGSTSLLNFLSAAIMVLVLVSMLIDFFLDERRQSNRPSNSAKHEIKAGDKS